ncbi:MAG: right-handed parallel beta-helix repeat-containing protein [Candidatus Cloacimonetes bacterium]|nr:right-handed parallel beta-helix repeat-containing protein [Candidatus Cloacimonadota bacterium]
MRTLTLLFFLMPFFSLTAITITVSLDGTEDYTSIQTAIDNSNDSDSILVHPGRYIENQNTNGHNVTITSLFAIDQNPTHIDSTIIDGNFERSVRIENSESVTFNGFTVSNNYDLENVMSHGFGGGFFIDIQSNVSILNSKIINCIAEGGGGITVGDQSHLNLENVVISNNKAQNYAGGIFFDGGATFSSTNAQVYNNVAANGMDLFFMSYDDYPQQFDFNFDMGSIALNSIDNFFVCSIWTDNITFSFANSYFTPIDSDVYVSPTGDNSNDGLTVNTALQSISYAMQLIANNPVIPRTIFLDSGIYSFSQNGQIMPFGLKPNVSLVGADMNSTIIDAELTNVYFAGWSSDNNTISDIRFENARAQSFGFPMHFHECTNTVLRNLIIDNSFCHGNTGIYMTTSEGVIIENVIIQNVNIPDEDMMGLATNSTEDIYVNNLIVAGHTQSGWLRTFHGTYFSESDVVARNCIFTDNTAQDGTMFEYQTIYDQTTDFDLDMSNILIYNNAASSSVFTFGPLYVQDRWNPVKITNCTFAHNTGNHYFAAVLGYAEVSNCIFFNPKLPAEIRFTNFIPAPELPVPVEADVLVQNCSFLTDSFFVDLPDLLTEYDNLYSNNPMFWGAATDSLDISMAGYYQLSDSSLCVNTGTQDTTGLNLPATDLAGNPRIWNEIIDMGVYETVHSNSFSFRIDI